MPLIPPNLNKDILKALKDSKRGKSQAQSEAILAKGLTRAIDKYIKSGVVNTAVATTGGAGTGVGAIT
tara:strand:- start:681 stop:884 length:204 start_codon:yes stop_codon:yes gene_type:complete